MGDRSLSLPTAGKKGIRKMDELVDLLNNCAYCFLSMLFTRTQLVVDK